MSKAEPIRFSLQRIASMVLIIVICGFLLPLGTSLFSQAYAQVGDVQGLFFSETVEPAVAGTWYLYQFNTVAFPDYPRFEVWLDGYYMSTLESTTLGVYVFDRANMVAGKQATLVKFTTSEGNATLRSSRILPSDLDGPPPPAGSPNFFFKPFEAGQDNTGCGDCPKDQLRIHAFTADWQPAGTPSFTLVDVIDRNSAPALAGRANIPCNIGDGGVRSCIRQPDGGAQTVDALTGRPMMQLKYRNFDSHETLVVNQTVDADGNNNAGIRCYKLRRTAAGSGNWNIHQQRTYAPQQPGVSDTTWVSRWMGSPRG